MNILTGNVTIKRIWQLLKKTVTSADLANYSVAIDSQSDSDTKRISLDELRIALMNSGLFDYRGDYDASVNLYPASGGSGTGGAILKANAWIVSVGGNIDGNVVIPGQILMAKVDNPDQTSANWFISLAGGSGSGDMILSAVQSVTGLKTFDNQKVAIKGSSTGKTALASANASANDCTATFPAKNITVAGLDDIVNFYDYNIAASEVLNTVYAAGKRRIIISSNTTLNADLTITENTFIYLRDFTLTCATYGLIINAGVVLTIEGIGTITFAYGSEKILFNGNVNVTGEGNSEKTLTITNSSTATLCRISDTGNFSNVIVNAPNYNYIGFGSNTSNFVGKLNYITFNSGGSNCIPLFSSTLGSILSNSQIVGTFNTITCYQMTNIYSLSAGIILCLSGNNIIASSATLRGTFVITNFYCSQIHQSSNNTIYTNGIVGGNQTISALSLLFNNVRFLGSVTITGDYNKLNGCPISGLLTLSSGAENNNISNCTLTGGLTDNSGNSTNIIKDNI